MAGACSRSRTLMPLARQQPFQRIILAVVLFGAAFGHLETVVVSYLRDLHEPARQRFYPGRPSGDLFPLLTLDQIRQSCAVQPISLVIESGRESATIVMRAAG